MWLNCTFCRTVNIKLKCTVWIILSSIFNVHLYWITRVLFVENVFQLFSNAVLNVKVIYTPSHGRYWDTYNWLSIKRNHHNSFQGYFLVRKFHCNYGDLWTIYLLVFSFGPHINIQCTLMTNGYYYYTWHDRFITNKLSTLMQNPEICIYKSPLSPQCIGSSLWCK
jgi:hypothetical protein